MYPPPISELESIPAEADLETPDPFARAILARVPRILLPALAILAVGIGVVSLRERAKDRSLARRAAEGVVQLQAGIIEREIEIVASFLSYLTALPGLDEALGGEPATRLNLEYVQVLRSSGLFERVRLLAPSGRELLHVHMEENEARALSPDLLGEEPDQEYLARALALESGEVYLSRFRLASEAGRIAEPWKPIVRLATPVVNEKGERLGILDADYEGANLFERVSGLGEQVPGWAGLINERGYYLEAPEGSPSWGFLFGLPPTFAARHRLAWKRIRGKESGSHYVAGGLYVHRQIVLPSQAHSIHGDPSLLALSFVPSAELHASSWNTIRILLVGGGLVALGLSLLSWRLAYAGVLRKAHERRLAASEEGLRRLSTRLMDAQEEERRRVSRDLHDELGQEATALLIELKRAERAATLEEKTVLVGKGIEAGEHLLASLHRIASRLRTSILDDLGLRTAVSAMCSEFEERTGIETVVDLGFRDDQIPENVARNLYSFVQEALTNAMKHSKAKETTVSVLAEDRQLRVEVRDDGTGFDVTAPAGDRLGLLGMRERVEQLGGTYLCTSRPGRGTRVLATIPLGRREGPRQ